METLLHALIQKQAIAKVKTQTSLEFFNLSFLVPKPNNNWGPIPDLSLLNKFLGPEEFQDHCLDTTVLITIGNTTVVAYINKK